MITKDLITSKLAYHDVFDSTYSSIVNYNEFCNLIDRWKYLLVSKGAVQGNSLALSILRVTVNHAALIFAAGELGLQLFILESPISAATIHKTKLGMFGPVDFTVECEKLHSSEVHHLMVKTYSKTIIAENDILGINDTYVDRHCSPEMPFLIASTSGTTQDSKPVIFTQREVYEISKRNINVFKFDEHTRVAHSRNMHHASSLLTEILPSLMVSTNHYETYHTNSEFRDKLIPAVRKYNINRILMKNQMNLSFFLNQLDDEPLKETLLINMSGFTVPEYFIEVCKKYNIEFVSHFGSIDTGIPVLVNYVNPRTPYIKDSLGNTVDDFYNIKKVDNKVLVSCTTLWGDKQKPLQDDLEFRDGCWIHCGRTNIKSAEDDYRDKITCDFTVVVDGNKKYAALWEYTDEIDQLLKYFDNVAMLDKEMFTTETKVNMDQLRAYFLAAEGHVNSHIVSAKLEVRPEGRPFARVDKDKLQNMISAANARYDIEQLSGVILFNHNNIPCHYIIFMSYNKHALADFLRTDGNYIFEIYKILTEAGYKPELTYNNV